MISKSAPTTQLLLTRDVVEYPESLANAINAFESLFELGVIPVVNENDAVSVDEMDHATKFGIFDHITSQKKLRYLGLVM